MKDSLMVVLILGASGLIVVGYLGIRNWLKQKHELEDVFKSRSSHQ